jgi:hypothetical protein
MGFVLHPTGIWTKQICLYLAITRSKMRFSLPFLALLLLAACHAPAPRIQGTWRLLSGTTITKGDTSVTDYTKNASMIKIVNGDHFAFLKHDLGGDSSHFDGGGGRYTLKGDQYTEYLDYYSDRNWEGKPFSFTVRVVGDTLIQEGKEKVDKEGVDRVIIERYVRVD